MPQNTAPISYPIATSGNASVAIGLGLVRLGFRAFTHWHCSCFAMSCSIQAAVAGPRLWNTLPIHLRLYDSLEQFKRLLKTHLFGVWDRGALRRLVRSAVYKSSHLLTYLLTYPAERLCVWIPEPHGAPQMLLLMLLSFAFAFACRSVSTHIDSRLFTFCRPTSVRGRI